MPLFGAPNIRKLEEKRDVEGLARSVRYRDWGVRMAAAEALGRIGDAGAVEPLGATLKDEDWRVRIAAAEALGRIGDAGAVEPLGAALKDDELHVRIAAAEALGRIGDAGAVEPLGVALKDPSSQVRQAAARALGQTDDARAVEALVTAVEDQSSPVSRAVANALKRLGAPTVSAQAERIPRAGRRRFNSCFYGMTLAERFGVAGRREVPCCRNQQVGSAFPELRKRTDFRDFTVNSDENTATGVAYQLSPSRHAGTSPCDECSHFKKKARGRRSAFL